jgi:hypothetical protein
MDRDQLWMDDRRCTTGDGSQEMDHGRRMTINLLPYTKIRRHTVFRRHGSTEYDAEHYSEHYSEIPNHAPTCLNFNAEYDPESDHESISYNADTAHHEAV